MAVSGDNEWSICIYLAGPLDNIEAGALEWRSELVSYLTGLRRRDVCLLSPQHAFIEIGSQCAASVMGANRAMIGASDAVLASLENGEPFGTVREIEYAVMLGKMVVCCGEKAMMASLWKHDLTLCSSTETGLDEILAWWDTQ